MADLRDHRGGEPTGVELAGIIAELARNTLRGDFRNFDAHSGRVILVEACPCILAGFTDDLSAYGERALNRLGVEVRLGQPVSECRADGMLGGDFLPARTTLWAAGVAASPAAEWVEAPSDRAGRVCVEPDLTAPGQLLATPLGGECGRQAGAWRGAGRQAGGARRRRAHQGAATGQAGPAAIRLQECRQSRDDRQAGGDCRFRLECWLQCRISMRCRHIRMPRRF